jgi:hypothetical protein
MLWSWLIDDSGNNILFDENDDAVDDGDYDDYIYNTLIL